ncbi:uncharacterized protein LOC108667585 [Hyalella azteca]|uniref:Uncharacterized protein LOC108667585 n=1 Tax=Hyalella azteca TaxID=294128 RepID=A0A8B7N8E7_HYAAZ|nr:uncharacterized protein LOC108667585 [Hyalella azteca]
MSFHRHDEDGSRYSYEKYNNSGQGSRQRQFPQHDRNGHNSVNSRSSPSGLIRHDNHTRVLGVNSEPRNILTTDKEEAYGRKYPERGLYSHFPHPEQSYFLDPATAELRSAPGREYQRNIGHDIPHSRDQLKDEFQPSIRPSHGHGRLYGYQNESYNHYDDDLAPPAESIRHQDTLSINQQQNVRNLDRHREFLNNDIQEFHEADRDLINQTPLNAHAFMIEEVDRKENQNNFTTMEIKIREAYPTTIYRQTPRKIEDEHETVPLTNAIKAENVSLAPPKTDQSVSTTNPSSQSKTPTAQEAATRLLYLRQEPLSLCEKRALRRRLRPLAALDPLSATDQVVSSISKATNHSRSFINNAVGSVDVIQMIKKRIEAEAGSSVAAVFDLCNDLLRLNLLLGLLLLLGIVIPTTMWQEDDPQFLGDNNVTSCNTSHWNYESQKGILHNDCFNETIFVQEEVNDQLWGWITEEDLQQSGLPAVFMPNDSLFACSGVALTESNGQVRVCSRGYIVAQDKYTSERQNVVQYFMDFLQGLGFMERTSVFIGWYAANLTSSPDSYDISVAYLLTVTAAYAISIVYVVRGFGRWLCSNSKIFEFTNGFNNLVFKGWDFNVGRRRTAAVEKILLVQEIRAANTEEEHKANKFKRTVRERRVLFLVRCLIHVTTIGLILGGWVAIYFVVTKVERDTFIKQYATTLTVSGLNFILPPIFFVLSWYEHYTQRNTLLLYIMRNIFLRLISIVILVVSEISLRIQEGEAVIDCGTSYMCWETRLAQQLYSLIVFDTMIYIPVTAFVFIRYFLSFVKDDNPLVSWLPKIIWEFLSQPEFDTAGHVLRAVHLQTLCWMGISCAPLLPLMTVVSFLIMIILNGITIKFCRLRPSVAFRSSTSSSMFMVAALVSLVLSVVPSALVLTYLKPSFGCSPFRGLQYQYQAFVSAICLAPAWIRDILFYLPEFLPMALALLAASTALVYQLARLSAWKARQRFYESRVRKIATEKKMILAVIDRTKTCAKNYCEMKELGSCAENSSEVERNVISSLKNALEIGGKTNTYTQYKQNNLGVEGKPSFLSEKMSQTGNEEHKSSRKPFEIPGNQIRSDISPEFNTHFVDGFSTNTPDSEPATGTQSEVKPALRGGDLSKMTDKEIELLYKP